MIFFTVLGAYFLVMAVSDIEIWTDRHIMLIISAGLTYIGLAKYKDWVSRRLEK